MDTPFALSTHWNAFRHKSGEAIIDEILSLGIRHVELGYDLSSHQAEGILRQNRQGMVTVVSVHNYCPVPPGAPSGGPELLHLADRDARASQAAVTLTTHTIEFAAQMKARCVVVHAGYVRMRHETRRLVELSRQGQAFTPAYDKLKLDLMMEREKRVQPHLDMLYRAIEQLIPSLESAGMVLALENLPAWESVPSEQEVMEILRRFDARHVAYWHDTGHGQTREYLGFISHRLWVDRLADRTAGMHIHDSLPPDQDHLMPPCGKMDFTCLAKYMRPSMHRVLEPRPGTPADQIATALEVLRKAWQPA